MKDTLLRDIELRLATRLTEDQRETAMQCIIASLKDYEVEKKVTDIVVRHEDENERLLKRYAACLRIDGKSEGTVKQYVRTMIKLAQTLQKPYTEMTAYDIRYFLGMIKEAGTKNSHVETQRAYISAFFNWMYVEEIIPKNPCAKVKPIKVEKEIRYPFSSVEIDKMRATCKRPVDRAVMEVLLSSGVRCEELCNLKRSDVDIVTKKVSVKCGKGGKDRVTYISDLAAEHLKAYLATRKDDDEALFYSSPSKQGYTVGGIKRLCSKLGERAKVENVHPHRFRRTFATELYRRGMDINSISILMGHSNIATTQRYIYSFQEQLSSDYKKYSM